MVQERVVERRDAGEHVRAHALQRAHEVVEVAGVRHQREPVAPHKGDGLRDERTVRMEERQRQHDAARDAPQAIAQPFDELAARVHHAAMPDLHALRRPGRATGEQDERFVLRPGRCGLASAALERRQPCAPLEVAGAERGTMAELPLHQERERETERRGKVLLDVRRDHALDGRPCTRIGHPVVERVEGDHHPWRERADPVAELFFGVDRVQRADHRADHPRPEFCDHELRAVRQHEGDAVAAAYAHGRERAGGGMGGGMEVRPGDGAPLEPEGRPVGRVARGVGEIVEQRPVRVLPDRPGDAAVVVGDPPFLEGRHAANPAAAR